MGKAEKKISTQSLSVISYYFLLVIIFYSDKTKFLLLKTKANEFTDFAKLKIKFSF